MYGRYGTDQLNIFLLVIFFLLWVAEAFVRNQLAASILSTLSLILALIVVFRVMSRNYGRRRAENDAFLKVFGPVIHWFKRKRAQARDKDHEMCIRDRGSSRSRFTLPSRASAAAWR